MSKTAIIDAQVRAQHQKIRSNRVNFSAWPAILFSVVVIFLVGIVVGLA